MKIMAQSNDLHVLFTGFITSTDDEEDIDFNDFDNRAYSLQNKLDQIEPNRDPRLETEYLGNNLDFELKFTFQVTWMDRNADEDEYIDKVQAEIENDLGVIIIEKSKLGYTRR